MKTLPKTFAGRCIQRERLCVHPARGSSCAYTTSRVEQIPTGGGTLSRRRTDQTFCFARLKKTFRLMEGHLSRSDHRAFLL